MVRFLSILALFIDLRCANCSREHISIYTVHGEPLIFQHFDGPFYPTLRLLHKCERLVDVYRASAER